MADVSTIIAQSSGSISGALDLELILASSEPYNFSDFNYKINSWSYPTSSVNDAFPVSGSEWVAPASAFDMIIDDEACKGSIHNIINTNKLERVMRPNFGVNLSRTVFELVDDDTIDIIQFEMTKAFAENDDRLYTKQVQIIKDEANNTIAINCEVGIKGINRTVPVVFRNRAGAF
jgi:phage baseplate assembly protein W